MKELTIRDLNPTLLSMGFERAKGMLDLANLVNAMYARSSTHPYLIGDCALAKLNMLRKRKRPRRNPHVSQ